MPICSAMPFVLLAVVTTRATAEGEMDLHDHRVALAEATRVTPIDFTPDHDAARTPFGLDFTARFVAPNDADHEGRPILPRAWRTSREPGPTPIGASRADLMTLEGIDREAVAAISDLGIRPRSEPPSFMLGGSSALEFHGDDVKPTWAEAGSGQRRFLPFNLSIDVGVGTCRER